MRTVLTAISLLLFGCGEPKVVVPQAQPPIFSPMEAQKSVVRLVVFSDDFTAGSGISVAPNVVLTNLHVIVSSEGNPDKIAVWDAGSQYPRLASAVLAIDTRMDLALVYVRGLKASSAEFSLFEPKQLDRVSSIGFPGSTDLAFGRLTSKASVTVGEVTAVDSGAVGDGSPVRLINHTGSINPGNSGGPLFNACGQVVGVNTLKADPKVASNVGLATASGDIVPFLYANGVFPRISSGICAPGVETECSDNTEALDEAFTAGAIDRALPVIAATKYCKATGERISSSYDKTLRALNELVDRLSGNWRSDGMTCSDGVQFYPSGRAVLAKASGQSQYEEIVSFSGSSLTTKVTDTDTASEYEYVPSATTLKIINKNQNKTWELQRCSN